MDVTVVKTIVIGVVLMGALVVAPIIMALLSHQQKMTQLLSKQNSDQSELLRRVEMLERRLGAGSSQALPPEPSSVRSNLEGDQLNQRTF